jgi:transaldolase
LVFTLSQMVAVAEAVKSGLALARAYGVDLSAWRSVCTMMLGRFEDCQAFDRDALTAGVEVTPTLRRWAGIAITNRAVTLFRERGYETKVLAASMRVGPEINGQARVWHIEKLLGQPIVLTIFPNIIEAWLEHYDGETLPTQPSVPPEDVLAALLRVPYFREGYEEGQDPASFATHPAVVVTGDAFAQATDQLQEWVRGRIEKVRG